MLEFFVYLILLMAAVWIGVDASGRSVAVYGSWVDIQRMKYELEYARKHNTPPQKDHYQ